MNTYDDAAAREGELASGEIDEVDEALLAEVAALYADIDPMPDGLVERIKFEITLDALRAEVATLTRLDLATSGARSSAAQDPAEVVRTITFSADAVTTMVTISRQSNGTVRVDGWAVPGASVSVEVLLADGTRRTRADQDGRFVFDSLPTGLAKFVLHPADAAGTVVSPTVEL